MDYDTHIRKDLLRQCKKYRSLADESQC